MAEILKHWHQRGGVTNRSILSAVALFAIVVMAVIATTSQAQGTPGSPRDFVAGDITSTSVRLSWNPGEHNGCLTSDYRVVGSEVETGRYVFDQRVRADAPLPILVTGLKPSTSHIFDVIAYSSECHDQRSAETRVHVRTLAGSGSTPASTPSNPPPLTLPNPPRDVRVHDLAPRSVRLAWTGSASGGCLVTEYEILGWEADFKGWYVANSLRVSATAPLTITVNKLKPQTEYEFDVYARGDTCDARSGYFRTKFTTPPEPTPTPTDPHSPGAILRRLKRGEPALLYTPTPVATNTPEGVEEIIRTLNTPIPQLEATAAPTSAPIEKKPARKKPAYGVRNLRVTPSGTSATVVWKPRNRSFDGTCAWADPPQYRYKVVLWTGAVGDRIDREEVIDHTTTSAQTVEVTDLTAGTEYAVLVWAYSDECADWSKFRRTIWTQ